MMRNVAALLGLLLSTQAFAGEVPKSSFRANNCGDSNICVAPPQTGFEAGHYNVVRWSTVNRADQRDRFADNGWSPVATGEPARTVQFAGQILILNGLPGSSTPPNYVARIVKNGDDNQTIGAKIGLPATQFGPNVFVIDLSMQDVAGPGDSYQVKLFSSHPAAIIDNNPMHSWWSGQ